MGYQVPMSRNPKQIEAEKRYAAKRPKKPVSIRLDDDEMARLDKASFASLQALGAYLIRHSDQSIALVGHTDSSGSHEANLDLSKQRAEAVRTMLLDQFPLISPTRVGCEGIGYFSPLASNAAQEGREINRRVEVILVPTRP